MTEITSFQDAGLRAPVQSGNSRTELGQQDFLKLMITQFKNQDPFEPMDNGDFLGQLAQFSTVNGIESLNQGFNALSSSMQSDQILQAASLVGQRILAGTSAATLTDRGEVSGALELDSRASNVQIEITSRNGELVQRLDLGEQDAGLVRFTWDGKNLNGDRAPADTYAISARVVRGANISGNEVLLEAEIDSVSLGQLGQELQLNLASGDTLPVSLVRRLI